MKNRINNILIGLLWLLAISLGASFWFNTKYGFNIFSLQHWQYLAYMQASNQSVKTSFYISFLVIILVAVFGLYRLLQPRMRQIILPVIDNKLPEPATMPQATQPISAEPVQPAENSEEQKPIQSVPSPARPPRLNIPTITRTTTPVPHVPLTHQETTPTIDAEQKYADIHEIFTSNGFVYKGSPRIKGMQTSVIAIGSNEVLWVGATHVSTSEMQRAIDTLLGIFTDTLDDIEINIHAFIIDATDNSDNGTILRFANVDELREYISKHPNTPLDDDEIENFDAYSGYIGTVIDYIGKI